MQHGRVWWGHAAGGAGLHACRLHLLHAGQVCVLHRRSHFLSSAVKRDKIRWSSLLSPSLFPSIHALALEETVGSLGFLDCD